MDTLYFVLAGCETEAWTVEKNGSQIYVRISPGHKSMLQACTYIYNNFEMLTAGYQQCTHQIQCPDFLSSTEAARPVEPFDKRNYKGLESLFDKDYILLDKNHDLLPDYVDAKILISEIFSFEQLAAACNIATRLGLETTAISLPVTCNADNGGNMFVFDDDNACKLSLEESDGRVIFRFTGHGSALCSFSNMLCETFPKQKAGLRWTDILQEIAESLAMENIDGQITWLDAHKQYITSNSTDCYFSPKISEVTDKVKNSYSPARFFSYKDLNKVFEKEYAIDWEVDIFHALLNEQFWHRVRPGDYVTIHAVLSEDKNVRNQIEQDLLERALACGAQKADIEIICAHKQGFCWLEEIVLPQLRELPAIDAIEIAFRPFIADNVGDWQDEDGATPSYNNISLNDADKWYDLPIRYLQELYPIDDVMAKSLNMSRDKIFFSVYEGGEDITYTVTAKSRDKNIYQASFKTACMERNYLDAYKQMGKVHPSTGRLLASINGEIIIEERIRTDVEAVWDIYQKDILPLCRDYCEQKTGVLQAAPRQPFFAQLRLDLHLSEPNERLNCREEHISSLDALHEDIYFVGLDFFKAYGICLTGKIFDAPGLILPVIHKTTGRPYFKFTLFDHLRKNPCIDFGDTTLKSNVTKKDIALRISDIYWENNRLRVRINVNAPLKPEVLSAYANLLEKQIFSINKKFANVACVELQLTYKDDAPLFKAAITETAALPKDMSITDIDIHEHQIIGYEQYMAIMEQLKRVPGISVYKIAESYLGRDIYAIELLSDYDGYVSPVKRINRNPSVIINARHHANEVSSTNAALMLLRELLTCEEFKGLGNHVALSILPFENADGAQIHYELQQDNPHWKLHIARFNAIGKEFYDEYFKEDTIHTEAHGFTRLWRGCLPDIVVDNHGVPSHEWEQPFSGYTSPSYKGFWLPRSLLYGYFWSIKDSEYQINETVNKKIEEIVSDIISSDEEIETLNGDWQERFSKYANSWMPKQFPARYYKNMINYWIYFDYDSAHRHVSIRYPWITTVDYTSEVADETAQGDYLNLCARAHLLHDIAIIRMLRDCKSVFKNHVSVTGQELVISCQRQRPIIPA